MHVEPKKLVPSGPLLYRWDDVVLSFSRASQLRPHTHQAAELVIALDQPVASVVQGKEISAQSLLIPPGVEHQNSHADVISAVIYLDVESYRYQQLAEQMQARGGLYVRFPGEQPLRDALIQVYAMAPSAQDCYARIVEPYLSNVARTAGNLDERVLSVVTLLKQNPAQDLSVPELAEQVGLSADRLHHLFTEQLGLPLHRYRIWLRLKHASRCYLLGQNLTEAALEAGFADAAHFSRTFARMYGGKPSQLLAERRQSGVYFG